MIKELLNNLFTKTAFQLRATGISGRALPLTVSVAKLTAWHRRNELAYACVQKIADAAIDPRLVFEVKQDNGTWKEEDHPLTDLVTNPNPTCDSTNLMTHWVTSEHVSGNFYAEIVRGRGTGKPVQLWPLHPGKLKPIPTASGELLPIHQYEYADGANRVELDHQDVFVHRNLDICNPYNGLAPLGVALGSVDADSALTDYVRMFFDNGGVPSGLLKVKGKILKEQDKTKILDGWLRKYDRWGDYSRGPAILDEAADYERIGMNLNELESQALRYAMESRICGVFGVPPLLVSALVGLAYVNQRASAAESQKDFWQNKMSPLFKRYRSWLTHSLLPEWETQRDIKKRLIRLHWDMSDVYALQEDLDVKLTRARNDFEKGAITLNQYLETCKLPRDPNGDYYLRPVNLIPVGADQILQQQQAVLFATEQAVLLALTARRETATAAALAGSTVDPNAPTKAMKSADARKYRYQAEGDKASCQECKTWDGVIGTREELPEVPNPKCGGGYGKCRCLLIPE